MAQKKVLVRLTVQRNIFFMPKKYYYAKYTVQMKRDWESSPHVIPYEGKERIEAFAIIIKPLIGGVYKLICQISYTLPVRGVVGHPIDRYIIYPFSYSHSTTPELKHISKVNSTGVKRRRNTLVMDSRMAWQE